MPGVGLPGGLRARDSGVQGRLRLHATTRGTARPPDSEASLLGGPEAGPACAPDVSASLPAVRPHRLPPLPAVWSLQRQRRLVLPAGGTASCRSRARRRQLRRTHAGAAFPPSLFKPLLTCSPKGVSPRSPEPFLKKDAQMTLTVSLS